MAIENRVTKGNVLSMAASAVAASATILTGYGAYVTTQNTVKQNAKDIVALSASVVAHGVTAREEAAKARAEIDLRIENTRADYGKQLLDIRQDAGRQRETIQAMQIDAAKNGARFDALSDKLDELKGLVMQALDQKGALRR